MVAPRGTPTDFPTLAAAEACRGVAYLCADLAEADRMRIQRWRDPGGPLIVHVPPPPGVPPHVASSLQRAATAGVRLWNGQPFPVLVDERGTREAHVEIRWVSNLGGSRIGVAKTQWSPATGLTAISLELAVLSPFGGSPVDPAQLRLTAAHEMGHILGLPHSDQPRDVMYPVNTSTALSARDYRTVEALYQIEDGTEIVR